MAITKLLHKVFKQLYYYTFSHWYYTSVKLLSATKSFNNKRREFSADAVWPLQAARLAMACCWKNTYVEPENSGKLKPGTRLFGISWWKVIQTLWLYEIAQVSLLLLARGAKVVNVQAAMAGTKIGICLTN